MRTFLLDSSEAELSSESLFSPDEERARYLTRVLRLQPGSIFPGVDSRGKRYLINLETENPCTLRLRRAEDVAPQELSHHFRELPEETTDFPPIILIQAILKGKKMDQVIRQATEAGADIIIPVISERSIVRIDPGDEEKKRERWLSVMREAVQQSGAKGSPDLAAPLPLAKAQAIGNFPGIAPELETIKLFFHERPLAQQRLHVYLSGRIGGIVMAIGPEGGFSPGELSAFASADFKPAFLSGNILRAETAAVYALGAVKSIIAERESWRLAE
jgi:16S rRNA (uracil1498-N3)-methyltransferase